MNPDRSPEPGAEPDREAAPLFAEEEITLDDVHWSDGIVLVLFWGLAFVVFLQFFTRYILNSSLGWTEEVARFMLIGVTFVGGVMVTRKRSHIAVEFLYRWLSRPMRRVLQTFVDVVSLVFYIALAAFSAQMASRTKQAMVTLPLPKSAIYWGVAICFAIMAFYAAAILVRHWRSGTSRLIDPELHAEPVRNVE